MDGHNVCKLVWTKSCSEAPAAARSCLGWSGGHAGKRCYTPGSGGYKIHLLPQLCVPFFYQLKNSIVL